MTNIVENQELLQDFLAEAGEMLDDVDIKLVELEKRPDDANLLNAVFRGFHTIKGGAGFLEATPLVELCHRGENLLDALRNHKMTLNSELMDVILAATSDVRRMFSTMTNGLMPEPAQPELLETLDQALAGGLIEKAAAISKQAASEATTVLTGEMSGPDWDSLYAVATGKEIAVEAGVKTAVTVQKTKAPSNAGAAPVPSPSGNKEAALRVDISRFDQILNLAGEVGLTKNRLLCLRQDVARGNATPDTFKALDQVIGQLDTLVSGLQNAVMKARMQPVGRVFQKYVRMARDLARQLGKELELQLHGEDTELDKTLLDELHDPLVHLIRNAVDHGVETPAERAAAGKPAKALVTIVAQQAGDSVVIEVSDDGKGIRPEVIRQKAVEKDILPASEANLLSDKESFDLIFLPGFSTKQEISDVSGRGVGMDVVKTNIQRLSGRIEIHSEAGRGSRFTIILPLTLAILPVLVVRLEKQPFALPLAAVREVINLDQREIQEVAGKPSIVIRGEVLPIIRLTDLLGWSSESVARVGVLTELGGITFVLAVDSFVGREDVIIKPLDAFKPEGVAGATLSREGVLVLVLDLRELLEMLQKSLA